MKHRTSDIDLNEDEQTLPYYGGLKGQYVHLKDGKVLEISTNEKQTNTGSRQGPIAASSQIDLVSHDRRHVNEHKSTFEEDFNKIQQAAARLVALQELAKHKGNFSPEDNRVYAASLLELGKAAQNLALLQQTGEVQDFSVLLRPMQATQMPQKTPNISEAAAQGEKVDTVMEQHLGEPELLPPNHEDPYEDVNDSVAITPPKKDASVAEAKPVGVSIAGEGGVASAKPNAVALSGRNGLAVSAPKATAIAGVSAEEAAAFSISVPSRQNLVIKNTSSRSAYDDYGDIETSPQQAIVPLRSASSDKTKARPMQATVNAADAIIKMWHNALAQNQADSHDARERHNDFNMGQYFKNSKRLF